ncbi:MAG: transporter, partial [Hyphomicrobiales bacterium]|nr:transporter [Hyphomicrobiales bacterium]
RKLLMIGGAGFGAASILAAFSPTATTLILSRALLGIAGATISPSILALITNMFRDPAQRGFAISIWMVCFMAGMIVGPLVGGAMLENFWWGSVFLLGVPVMLLLLATAPFLLPEYRDPNAGRIDLISVVLSLCTILPVIYGLKEIAKSGMQTVPVLFILVGITVGAAFVLRQRSLDDPLFDLRLFGNRAFTTAVIAMFGITSTGAVMLFMSQYMQLVLGLSPLHAGLWTLPGVVAMAISLMLSPVVAKKVRPAPLIAGGLVVSTIGALLMTQGTAGSGLPFIVIGFILFNSGCAPMVTLGSGIVVSSVVPEKAGSAAALSETSSEFGFALGIAILGSIVTAIYRTQIGGTLPAGIPDGAASGARDSLAGAAAAAASLPAEMGAALLSAAQQAFLSGMHVAAGICAGILLCVGLLAVTTLRNLRPLGETQPTPQTAKAGAAERTVVG